MTTALTTAGIVISGAALGVAALSVLFTRRQLFLTERSRARDLEATVVAELVAVQLVGDDTITVELRTIKKQRNDQRRSDCVN